MADDHLALLDEGITPLGNQRVVVRWQAHRLPFPGEAV